MGAPRTWERWATLGARWLLAAMIGGTIGSGCDIGMVDYPLVWARCDPSQDLHCTDEYFCCSDDPASLEPNGEPLFSQAHNQRSRSGFCVRIADISGQGLDEPEGCPIPCNPTWAPDRLLEVCGESASCCQTVELHEDDCVLDEDLGQWRAADGREAVASLMGGDGWRPTPDSTHQDPDFMACEAVASGDRGSDLFRQCLRALTTANQRGYCTALGLGQPCPTRRPDYVDACEAMN